MGKEPRPYRVRSKGPNARRVVDVPTVGPVTLSKKRGKPGELPVPKIDPQLEAKVEEQIARSSSLTKEQEEEALDREISIATKHHDLTELKKGRVPDRLVAEWAEKGGLWKVAALVVDFIRKFL